MFAIKPARFVQADNQDGKTNYTSVRAFGAYLIVVGLSFTAVPDLLLSLFHMPSGGVWARFVGVLAAVVGAYYLVAARYRLLPFCRATVWGRGVVVAFGLVMTLIGQFPPQALLIFVADGAGAVWTAIEIKRKRPPDL